MHLNGNTLEKLIFHFFKPASLYLLLSAYRYSVDNFSYSGPSGILGSDGKQNTA